jgi:hypothetical protein
MGGQIARLGKIRNAYNLLVEKPEEKILLARTRR